MENLQQSSNESCKENRIEKIVTHEGLFHTDEVFATAILKDLFPEEMELSSGKKVDFTKYIRTRNKDKLINYKNSENVLLADVGGEYDFEKFNMDHHQVEGAGARENGIKYAAAGLVWKHFGREWIKYVDVYSRHLNMTEEEIELVWKEMDEKYIQLMDSNDTGQMNEMNCVLDDGTVLNGRQFTLPEIVRLYNIDTGDGRNQQQRFDAAVEVFRNVTLASVYKYMDLVEGLRKFDMEKCEFSDDKKTVIIQQSLEPTVSGHILDNKEEFENIEFFAVLNDFGQYSIMVAPIKEGLRKYRNPNMIPKELRLGNDTKKLNELIGVESGMRLSHTSGFFASCKDIETARKFLEYCTKE